MHKVDFRPQRAGTQPSVTIELEGVVRVTQGGGAVIGCHNRNVTHMAEQKTDNRAAKLDGARVAAELRREVGAEVEQLARTHSIRPTLVVVRVGDDPASEVYVRGKVRACEELGINSEHKHLPAETSTRQLLDLVLELNAREEVDGILVQLPLPRHADETQVIETIDPAKDVDGFHPINVGRLSLRRPGLVPCTPAGIIELLKREGVEMAGSRACVVGRSNIVGRPMAELLLQHDATVTICHSRTRDLAAVTREADILVAAIGRAGIIRGEHVKRGAVVVDVGMNKVTDEGAVRELFGAEARPRLKTLAERGSTLVGDVHPAEVSSVAGLLTPVPGGVGPLTIAMLLKNTLSAARRRRGLER
jgi:methylenetetrahydrofolate dehydrogenase (NADP+) / methenyltetrahydrofolate cyclohydrolase